MIARLQGTIALKEFSYLIVDVHGIGYKVFAPLHVLTQVSQGDEVVVYTYTHVRDDALELYGFTDHRDLRLFEMLLGVSGIGCRIALGIFGNGTREEIVRAILCADTAFFSGVPRLGTKNAQKIIIELKGKLGDSSELALGEMVGEGGEDVVEALKSFGYSMKEAQDALKAVRGQTANQSERIRLALKYLGK
ncbi:MAG: Holliday junction branch migration protein RuvA [Candidatus Levybacteria bacterium]|nr:Holliday junction branch migration protein RuvA [Candidatus Levybacteria bacterium]